MKRLELRTEAPSTPPKAAESAGLAADVEAFLARGGRIDQVASGVGAGMNGVKELHPQELQTSAEIHQRQQAGGRAKARMARQKYKRKSWNETEARKERKRCRRT